MWDRQHLSGTVADLHARDLPMTRRAVWIMEPTVPTLVFGSAQRDGLVDERVAAEAGWATTRRRSGGGLVALDPSEVLWLDITIPRGDRQWSDDVGAAFGWVGDVWVRAFGALGVTASVHAGPPQFVPEGKVVCFAGLGSGEVSVAGRKIVGLSQRRTQEGARFQCLVNLSWQPTRWWSLVEPTVPASLIPTLESRLADGVVGMDELAKTQMNTHSDAITSLREVVVDALFRELAHVAERDALRGSVGDHPTH